MTIAEFNKQNLAALRIEFQSAIDAVAARHGLKAQLGNIGFSGAEFNTKLTVTVPAAKADAELENLKMFARLSNVDVTKVHRDSISGVTHKLVAYDYKKRTKPWVTLGSNGKKYLWSDTAAKTLFKSDEPAAVKFEAAQ